MTSERILGMSYGKPIFLPILKRKLKNPAMKIAVAQFQPKDGNKDYNLSVIDALEIYTHLTHTGRAKVKSPIEDMDF